ncbi:MAG TPA: hypothetical protein EYH30_03195 [Anaerolineales bacterium]|nr:hypothetical protein [Anaerolineae bacterium]HIQ01126.1 hypothetical protein [Anaerolineales bacterium]
MGEEQRPADEGVDIAGEVERIIRTARMLGVEVDETDVTQWLTAMAAVQPGAEGWTVDEETGVYGHRVTLLDFDRETLERYRRIADIVQLPDLPNVETAVSLSGSAAQGRIQRYPGDCDFFERVNIKAPTREEACLILSRLMRDKAIAFYKGPNYELIEVKFGTWKTDVVKEGRRIKAGAPISWEPEEVKAGRMEVFRPDGQPWMVEWKYGCLDPGWCKMDWVIAEPERGRVVNASNMLDVTWETPDGEIIPLDGFLDPYFQEVYLEAESVPLFAKLARHVSPQALGEYVRQLTGEVRKYTRDHVNYGKAAKRLYNIFRLTGRHEAAALIRELFDEPAALLYQVWSLLDTVDDAGRPGSSLNQEAVVHQMDALIRDVVSCCEGPGETEVVMALLRLRDDVTGWRDLGKDWGKVIADSRAMVENMVNAYFREKLMTIPTVVEFLEALD